ncbi:MAG: phosphoribosylglycinamide formyltransferase, partial [Solirubrobacterales bacterium]|nr:phosphoribosylglycinamide formyltransferase [Solirubrobacterales bacterium]
PSAGALGRARRAGIPTATFALADHHDRAARDRAMGDWLDARGVRLVVLAGYLALLDAAFLDRFPSAVVNVHPSLLPAFPGLRAVEQAVEKGVRVFGVTVHLVDEGVDTGPILLQGAVELPDATDPHQVLARLRPLEHSLLPEAVRLLARGAVRPDPTQPGRMIIGGRGPTSAGSRWSETP